MLFLTENQIQKGVSLLAIEVETIEGMVQSHLVMEIKKEKEFHLKMSLKKDFSLFSITC